MTWLLDSLLDWRWFDPKTLLECECLLALVFAAIFIGLQRIFPRIRGARSIAFSFMLVVPDAIFAGLRGRTSATITILMADALMMASLIAMYEALVKFTGGRSGRWLLWLTAFSSFAVVFFFTEVRPQALPRAIAVSLAVGLIRALSSAALLRRGLRSTQRLTLIAFGLFFGCLAVSSFAVAGIGLLHRLPGRLLEGGTMQAGLMVPGIVYLSVAGLGFLLLTGRELVARRRMESVWMADPASVNRRRMELNLAMELEQMTLSQVPFAIAMARLDWPEGEPESGRRDRENRRGDREDKRGRARRMALRDAGEVIAMQLRATDHMCRFDTDDFLLLFAEASGSNALVAAERCAAAVSKLNVVRGGSSNRGQRLTMSFGVAEAMPGDSAQLLICRSEHAMRLARNDGGNCQRLLAVAQVMPVAMEAVAVA